MISDNLMLNDDKTEFLIVGTRFTSIALRLGSTDVCPVKVARNLGSWFDEHLTVSTHISKLCGVAFYHLHNINGFASTCLENQRIYYISCRLLPQCFVRAAQLPP